MLMLMPFWNAIVQLLFIWSVFWDAGVQLLYIQSMFGHWQLLDAKYKTRILFLLPQCDAKCN